jgi:hypothetical protein
MRMVKTLENKLNYYFAFPEILEIIPPIIDDFRFIDSLNTDNYP